MKKDYKKELELINSNKRISERLMIIGLYNEFYNEIVNNTEDNFIKHYASFMEKTFEIAAIGLEKNEKLSVNAKQFMEIFFEILKKNRLSNMSPAYEIIEKYEKEIKASSDKFEYVNIIDKTDSISIDEKINIMLEFKEFIDNMNEKANFTFGKKNTKDLREKLLHLQIDKLKEFLKENNTIKNNDNLKEVMMTSTKEYLIKRLINPEDGLKDIQDNNMNEFLSKFNETEKKLWLIGIIYGISGYDRNDKKNEEKIIEEICQTLGITKMRYKALGLKMEIKYYNIMKKEFDELRKEDDDEDLELEIRKN